MGEDRFEMSQKERDRLKVLTEAKKGLITQTQAASQLEISERQVRRLVSKLRDGAIVRWCMGCVGGPRTVGSTACLEKRAIAGTKPARMPRLWADICSRARQQAIWIESSAGTRSASG